MLGEADKYVEEFKSYVLRVSHGLSFINHISWWIDKLKMENYHDSPEDKYDIKRGCREYIERN